jgi:hypothetical protein
MGLIYDDPRLAALTLMSIVAEESEGPSELTGRMREVLDGLARCNGAGYLAELVIALARARLSPLMSWHGPPGARQNCWMQWKPRYWKALMKMPSPTAVVGLPRGDRDSQRVGTGRSENKCSTPMP